MRATRVLSEEHHLIEGLLRCLGALVDEALETGKVDQGAARSILRLFERFVDRNHQEKEELYLFPHMLSRATSDEARRIARLFEEHALERRRFVGMLLHLEGACSGDTASVDRFAQNAQLFLRLQRTHLREEERQMLPLADALLTARDDAEILQGFRQIDQRLGVLADVHAELVELCRRFELVPPARAVPPVLDLPDAAHACGPEDVPPGDRDRPAATNQ